MDWSSPVIYTAIIAAIAVIGVIVKISLWAGSMNAMKKTFTSFMQEVRTDIKKILGLLAIPETVGSQSPLRLTDTGSKISEEINAKAWANEAAGRLKDELGGSTPYLIQKFCFEYVTTTEFNPPQELMEKMQASAYNHGVSLHGVYNVLAVELRDKLLKMHGLEPPE